MTDTDTDISVSVSVSVFKIPIYRYDRNLYFEGRKPLLGSFFRPLGHFYGQNFLRYEVITKYKLQKLLLE